MSLISFPQYFLCAVFVFPLSAMIKDVIMNIAIFCLLILCSAVIIAPHSPQKIGPRKAKSYFFGLVACPLPLGEIEFCRTLLFLSLAYVFPNANSHFLLDIHIPHNKKVSDKIR